MRVSVGVVKVLKMVDAPGYYVLGRQKCVEVECSYGEESCFVVYDGPDENLRGVEKRGGVATPEFSSQSA